MLIRSERLAIICTIQSLALLILLVPPAKALIVDWTKQSGTTAYESGSAVSVDGPNNLYVTGSIGIEGSRDAYVSRYDSSGSLLWTRQFGTTANELGSDASADGLGNVYIAGRTTGDLFAPNAGDMDAYLTKY